MHRFCYLHLKSTITVSFFFKQWHAEKSQGLTSWPVRESALQKLISRTSSLIDILTGLISSNSRRWYCAMLTPLSVNPTKWSNPLKQFVGNLPKNCLSVFDHFVKLALKGLPVFLSNRRILSLNKLLEFLVTDSSEKEFYIFSKNHRNNWFDEIA